MKEQLGRIRYNYSLKKKKVTDELGRRYTIKSNQIRNRTRHKWKPGSWFVPFETYPNETCLPFLYDKHSVIIVIKNYLQTWHNREVYAIIYYVCSFPPDMPPGYGKATPDTMGFRLFYPPTLFFSGYAFNGLRLIQFSTLWFVWTIGKVQKWFCKLTFS